MVVFRGLEVFKDEQEGSFEATGLSVAESLHRALQLRG
jgi:hypothetical protein